MHEKYIYEKESGEDETIPDLYCLCPLHHDKIPDTAGAAYYNTYTSVSLLNNAHSCYSTQGFAAGSTYTYSIKINSDETKAVIYRTRMSDGSTVLMTNGDQGTTYANYLGHANDIALHSNNGNYYMFVVTMKAGSMSLVKLKYTGATYYKEGNYTIKYNGENKAMSGVAITGKDAGNIYFLFKSGTNFYKGSLPLNATSGTIEVTDAFKINIKDALVNGSPVPLKSPILQPRESVITTIHYIFR